jgi:hypothetical protein
MSTSRLSTLLAGCLVVFSAAQATGNGLCTPDVAFKEVRFSHHASHRLWTGIFAVDASQCARSTGRFELSLVRQKETAPDLRFVEHATWHWGQAEVAVELAIDEAISDYGIRNIAPCICRD